MLAHILAAAAAVLAPAALAQSGGIQRGLQYGENWVPVQKDPEIVAANFPDVNVTLLSPAFADPHTVPAAFADGAEGPTDDLDLGKSSVPSLFTSTTFSSNMCDRFLYPPPRS